MKEIKSLTGLRGLAALYVATYHLLHPYQQNLPHNVIVFIKHGYVSVDMFFILSGFVMTLSSKKLFDGGFSKSNYILFIKKRFARIYPIYFLNILIAFFLLIKVKGLKILLINVFLLQVLFPTPYIIGPSWSLSAEWLAYLLFPFFITIVYRFKGMAWALTCIVLSICIIAIVPLNHGNFLNGFRSLQEINGHIDRYRGFAALFRCFAEYIIGIAIYRVYVSQKDTLSKNYPLFSLPCVLMITALLFIPDSDIVLVMLFACLILSLSVDKGIVANFFSSRPLYFLGEISYSLYLVHTLLVRGDNFLLQKMLEKSVINATAIAYVVFYLILISVSYFTYRFIEIPAKDFLRKKFGY